MGSRRAHIVIPAEFLAKIDAEVGPRKRSAYIIELAQAEYRRRKLLAFLESKEPVMRDEDHPELAAMGTAAWVRKMRRADEVHMEELHARYEQGE